MRGPGSSSTPVSTKKSSLPAGEPRAEVLAAVDGLLDSGALTIGFVGRFVAYKRPTLFLREPERLARILGDPSGRWR